LTRAYLSENLLPPAVGVRLHLLLEALEERVEIALQRHVPGVIRLRRDVADELVEIIQRVFDNEVRA
jgi:hypothetical protein